MAIPPNQRTITAKFTRQELINLAMGCALISANAVSHPNKWDKLRDKIKGIVDEHDEKQKEVN